MKKIVLVAFFSLSTSFAQAACTVPEVSSDKLRAAVIEHGGYLISDEICTLLTNNKLFLHVTGSSNVLNGTSIGWASVYLVSPDNVISDLHTSRTMINTEVASNRIADKLMVESVNASINDLDFNKAITEIRAYETQIANRFR